MQRLWVDSDKTTPFVQNVLTAFPDLEYLTSVHFLRALTKRFSRI
jgi:hypothetical protein